MSTATQDKAHALLSASAAHRWLNCTPSARLEDMLPDSTSEFAAEGSLAHEISELRLKKQYTEPMGPRKYAAALKKLQENPLYQPEMMTHVETYYDYIAKVVHSYDSLPYVVIEKRIDYSHIAPEGFGTVDFTAIGGHVLRVVDFKYGKGILVSAVMNPQMMLYALGIVRLYQMLYDIRTVILAIVQPRLDSISEWEISVADLIAWGESIKPIAAAAYAGEGSYNPGEWCRFCRAKILCRARSDFYTGMKAIPANLMSDAQIGEILNTAKELEKWAKELQDYAHAEALAGRKIPGWKLVEGRVIRKFVDQEEAFKKVIASGVEEAMLYERKPIALTNVEKLLGKAQFEQILTDQIVREPGKPALVQDTDKREEIAPRQSAAEAFKDYAQSNRYTQPDQYAQAAN